MSQMKVSQELIRRDCLQLLNGRNVALESLRQSELVVIGGTGFIGSWIAELVSALNDEYCFGIKLYLIARNVSDFSARLPHLAERSDIELIRSDVRQLDQFPISADWVIHAAANPDVRTHATNPLDTASVIVDGTMSVMRTAERLGRLKKILYLSSGLVCGPQSESVGGLSENAIGAPLADASFMYANAKRFAEVICSAARTQSRVPVLVSRPFSFIGPYQSLDTPWAQTDFLADALSCKPIRILGDGKVVRSYLYGSDAAYWLLKILIMGNSGDVVNVGSPVGVTLEDLANQIAKNFVPSPDILFNTAPRSIVQAVQLLPDTSRAQDKYGLAVYTPLDQAIKSTVKWCQAIKARK